MTRVAIWGCGRIGRAVAPLLVAEGFELVRVCDADPGKAVALARTLDLDVTGSTDSHTWPVDLVIDATGDTALLPAWRARLASGEVTHVVLTRREPLADRSVIFGYDHEPTLRALARGTVIAAGSCTGNAVVPFLGLLWREYPPDAVSCDVLHPMKQYTEFILRQIPTALPLSIAEHLPSLSTCFQALAMEIPVSRGMAIDVAITFRDAPLRLAELFAEANAAGGVFALAPGELDNERIIGSPHSCVLDRRWSLKGRHFRGLLWQDNEHGFACRVLDVCKHLRSRNG